MGKIDERCVCLRLYICALQGVGVRGGKVCNILQWSFLQHSSARSEKQVGESNNMGESFTKVCMWGILQVEFKIQNNWGVKSAKQSV